ncbi:predicted protein [Plenodomus lingam JN3]|uniref:Predicted protein n=1 Tax=Leptosphaeria maculans (strain JN3 / isolate v23.1.3 / race Av1-4-5-6-7-8) TaxID=985895 RepID=E5A2L3_LEPMJ|nr:predicted protein [Plenodomus lingam JN3]CBX97809.1 predicted protein [Plenodomus lingam JN3]
MPVTFTQRNLDSPQISKSFNITRRRIMYNIDSVYSLVSILPYTFTTPACRFPVCTENVGIPTPAIVRFGRIIVAKISEMEPPVASAISKQGEVF